LSEREQGAAFTASEVESQLQAKAVCHGSAAVGSIRPQAAARERPLTGHQLNMAWHGKADSCLSREVKKIAARTFGDLLSRT
jgi:hypothetical protein